MLSLLFLLASPQLRVELDHHILPTLKPAVPGETNPELRLCLYMGTVCSTTWLLLYSLR